MTARRGTLGLAAALALIAGCALRQPPPAVVEPPKVPQAGEVEGARLGRWIRVQKLDRRLTVYDDTTPIRSYPIVLGGDPYGAKLHEGDNRTPEGEYHILAKYPHRAWSRFMLLDYPTPLNVHLYDWSREFGLLPTNPGVGGQVGIHGTVDDAVNRRGDNWTRGCISLLNKDIEDLYSLVDVGTRVVIEK